MSKLYQYSMQTYTTSPNKKSSINILYPKIVGNEYDAFNKLIYKKVQSLVNITGNSSDTGVTINYSTELTLINRKMISGAFHGTYSVEGNDHPTHVVIPFNIDLSTLKDFKLSDLYTQNANFIKILFEKAQFPATYSCLVARYDFPDVLKSQTQKYQDGDAFSIPNSMSCFLIHNRDCDGVIITIPTNRETGYDYFEVQINKRDLQQFYRLNQKYWEE